MLTVKIDKLKINAKIGVSAKERKNKQVLIVSIKYSYKLSNNKNADDINCLVSYKEVHKFIKTYIASSHFKTLEKLIIECSKEFEKKFRVSSVFIKVEKPQIAKKYRCQSISVSK